MYCAAPSSTATAWATGVSLPQAMCSGCRVRVARDIQLARAGRCNARLDGKAIEAHCPLGEDCLAVLEAAVDKFRLSARAYQRILRVARTIADLADSDTIRVPHIAEALSLRQLDKRRHV